MEPWPTKRYEHVDDLGWVADWLPSTTKGCFLFVKIVQTPNPDIEIPAPGIEIPIDGLQSRQLDEHGVLTLRRYLSQALPRPGRILDCICTTSETGNQLYFLENKYYPAWKELVVRVYGGLADAATWVVSFRAMADPEAKLVNVRQMVKLGAKIHLVISGRVLAEDPEAWIVRSCKYRLHIVGDLLHRSGWEDIEFVDLSENTNPTHNFGVLPGLSSEHMLWVVTGVNRQDN